MTDYPFRPAVDLSDPAVMLSRVKAMITARDGHWFWEPCPLCGTEFGGQEWMEGTPEYPSSIPSGRPGVYTGICPFCTMAGRGEALVFREYRESETGQ